MSIYMTKNIIMGIYDYGSAPIKSYKGGIYAFLKSLRQHNKDLFLNKEKLQEQINKTLIRFLEFADSSQITS